MIEVGDILKWGFGQYLVVAITIPCDGIQMVILKSLQSNAIYNEQMSNVIGCINKGIITVKNKPITPKKYMNKHTMVWVVI